MPNPGASKRSKELARKEWHQQKDAKREERKKDKEERQKGLVEGEDPDIAGIIPGPQPVLEE